MDDLFDVFDDPSAGGQTPDDVPRRNKAKKDKSKKRQVDGSVKSPDGGILEGSSPQLDSMQVENGEEIIDSQDNTANNLNGPEAKRQRRAQAAEAVVADTFEEEASREVPVSNGLAGAANADDKAVVLSHQVRHQVALPPDYDYVPISQHVPPAEPARVWPFELDPFQKTSIASIERGESVLVSAHTSAGKTVVAEYAIAQCLKNGQRVIYTSPIKALSNQKYREFAAEFGDAGLMTGDVTINPTATCLVMTTEILRSMLYRGSEIMREVGWVVFDEIHYMRDKTRGVVWEETIILLPDKVRYVFLSATIPNAMQFAEWIVKTHNQPCHVVYTDYRPTPLQHYFFPAGAEGIHLIVDEKGVFREDNFNKAMSTIAEKQGDDPADALAKRKGRGKDKHTNKGGKKDEEHGDIYKIVRMVMLKAYNPVIVFSFSKRECETYALKMAKLSFNDDSEKDLVSKIFENAVQMLAKEDQDLPQIANILPLLRRGIGVHHSGLLPILKETIEILFQEGLIKVLFATETFSIGLNMPAKTVIFTSVRKFDGISLRWVTPSEFIQMSGRAGRRGLDDRGIVIMMIDEQMDPTVAQEIVRGAQDNLNSAFYLGYNMILNLMRVETISPEFMLERCFFQFQNTASVAGLEKELHQLDLERSNMIISDESEIRDYWELVQQLNSYTDDMRQVITHPNYCLPFMQPGRLVHIKHGDQDFGWGAVVNFIERKFPPNTPEDEQKPQLGWVVDVVLPIADSSARISNRFQSNKSRTELPPGIRPAVAGEKTRMEVVPVLLSCVHAIAELRIFPPKDLNNVEDRNAVKRALDEIQRRFPNGLALLDPVENMNINDESFKRLLRKIEVLEARLLKSELHSSPRLAELWEQYSEKVDLQNKIKETKKKISNALSIMQLDELKCRKRVLRRLQFIDEQEVVQLKARVACEISTGDELMLSELLFNGFFNDLTPEIAASVLSCFVFEEKAKEDKPPRDVLSKPLKEIQQQAKTIAKVSMESKLPVNEAEYVQSFKWQLMEVIYEWAHGKSFLEICKMTDVYEGSLIRVFRRLEELLRQMAQAAKVMGNAELEEKFEVALKKIRRDIVAAQSLYL